MTLYSPFVAGSVLLCEEQKPYSLRLNRQIRDDPIVACKHRKLYGDSLDMLKEISYHNSSCYLSHGLLQLIGGHYLETPHCLQFFCSAPNHVQYSWYLNTVLTHQMLKDPVIDLVLILKHLKKRIANIYRDGDCYEHI